jgi:hypothetical protein
VAVVVAGGSRILTDSPAVVAGRAARLTEKAEVAVDVGKRAVDRPAA